MKIAYLGNFAPTHSTESHLKLTLEELGHTVQPIQENFCAMAEVVDTANNSDMFLWTRTKGFLRFDASPMLKEIKVPTASYHLDLYWGISREAEIPTDPFWRTDFVFTPDGGSHAKFRALGINHHYMKPGVVARECYLAEPEASMICDVGFVGSLGYHAEWPYRKKLIEFLDKQYALKFKHFGNPNPTVRGHALNQAYASIKVAVGDSLCPNFNHPYYWSDRVYETLGRGGFLIHPKITGLEEEFEDKKHLVFYRYNDWNQLKRLIEKYLVNENARTEIRLAGHEHVKQNCTYTHRLTEMLKIMGVTPRVHSQPEVRKVPAAFEPPRHAPYIPPPANESPHRYVPPPEVRLNEPACDGWRKYRQ